LYWTPLLFDIGPNDGLREPPNSFLVFCLVGLGKVPELFAPIRASRLARETLVAGHLAVYLKPAVSSDENERGTLYEWRCGHGPSMRLYFHLKNGHLDLPDQKGVEIENPGGVRAEALKALAEISAEDPLLFKYGKGWRLNVADGSGEVHCSLALDDGVERLRFS
jgi:hypothetical protein